MTRWNPFLWDILSTLHSPCTINLIQAGSINPGWLCCVHEESDEHVHLRGSQEQWGNGKLVLLYYADVGAFRRIIKIQWSVCVSRCVCVRVHYQVINVIKRKDLIIYIHAFAVFWWYHVFRWCAPRHRGGGGSELKTWCLNDRGCASPKVV